MLHRICPLLAQSRHRAAEFRCPLLGVKAYVVIKRLPMRDGEFEYQIKSVTERDERVVRESELRPSPLGKKTWSADRTLALSIKVARLGQQLRQLHGDANYCVIEVRAEPAD